MSIDNVEKIEKFDTIKVEKVKKGWNLLKIFE